MRPHLLSRMSTRSAVGGAIGALLVFFAAIAVAVSWGGSGDSPRGLLAASGERTVEAGSARASFTVALTGGRNLPPGGVDFSGEGIFDFGNERGRISMDLADVLATAGARGLDGEVEVLTDDMVVYLRAPFFNQALGVSTTWVRLDLEKLTGEEIGADLGQLDRFTSNDPGRALAMLSGVSEGGVERVGEEDIRGVLTTHYRAEVDLEKAYEESDAVTDPEAFRSFIDQIGRRTVVVDAWLDGDGLLRRIEYTVPLADGSGGEARSSMDLYDFGTEVAIEPPALDDTTDLTELF